ncbi:hypothetical protein E4U59_002292 [Claviceps monticola]|nr:hypothetical protein E4U59_002292 [Claviceps monticola]
MQDAQGPLPYTLDTRIRIPIVRRSPDFHKKAPRVRPHDGGHDGDQGSETDEFEIDARQNHNPDAVRATIMASNPIPPSKRQDLPSQQSASSSMPSSSMPHRATLRHGETSISASDRPNMKNLRAMRERNLHHARAQHFATASSPSSFPRFPATTRQRNPWSDDDSTLLVRLIALERAKWSVIDRKHGHRFEITRNQQAYRDRARNMKVDFLLADTILPPGFDLVLLGKKEEIKVVAGRRNPHRKEDDRDENGRPINTRI